LVNFIFGDMMNIKSLAISLAVVSALSLSITGCGEDSNTDDNGGDSSTSTVASISKSYVKLFGTTARDYANSSAYDNSNNLYVVGQTKGNFETSQDSNNYDMFLRKLDSNGNTLCKFQYGTNSDDNANNVVVDSQNNIYVLGQTEDDFDGHSHIGNRDIFIMKFNSSCEKQSSVLLGTTENDDPKGMSIDSNDYIYITGWTDGEINHQTSQGNGDFFITKFDTDLTEIWTAQDGSNGNDWSNDIAVDHKGALYVVGSLDNDIEGETSVRGGEDCFIAKYNTSDGSRMWARNFGSANDSGGTDVATSVAVTSNGDAVVGFQTVADDSGIAYFTAEGVKSWQKGTEGYGGIPVAVGKDDVIYSGESNYGERKTLRKFTKDGSQIWSATMRTYGNFNYMWHSELRYNSNDGYIYVVGATETNFQDPFGADNNHTGSYDAYVMKFK
jgi:hypothetical protein